MKNDELIGILWVILVIVGFTLFMLVLTMGRVFGFPYQLNLTDGTIIDLNSSNNATNNFTIYIIYQNVSLYNVTNINYTNITYVNTTCLNCTNIYNQTYNNSYFEYGYNKSDLNGNFVSISDFNSYKSGLSYATKDELTNSFNNLNATITKPKEIETTWLWLSVLGIFLLVVGLAGYIFYMARGGE